VAFAASSFETHRRAMLLRMRKSVAMLQKNSSLQGAKRRSNPFFLCAARWIASLRSQ